MKRHSISVVAAAAFAVATVLTGCTGPATESIDATLTIGDVGGAAVTFDPAQGSVNVRNVLSPVYDTLIMQNSDSSYAPSLATEWSYSDPTTFEITLRDDVTFAGGEQLDADAVKANIEHVKNGGGALASQFSVIDTVDVVDPIHLVVNLSQPYPSLPAAFSSVAGMIADPASLGDESLATTPAGSGPYVLDPDRTIADDTYTYTRRDGYWNADHYPYETVVVKIIGDQQAMLNALVSGQIQVGGFYDVPSLTSLQSNDDIDLNVSQFNVGSIAIFDRGGSLVPALGDERVRQALNYAIDRETFATDVMSGLGGATGQMLREGLPGYDAELNETYPYDPDKARELLADAGYADGFAFDMVSISQIDRPAQAFASYLADVGVTINIVNVPANEYVSSMIGGQYPTGLLYWGAVDTFFDYGQLIAATGGFNPFHSTDAQIEEAMAAVLETADPDEQAELYRQINERVVELGWFVPAFTSPLSLSHTTAVSVPQFVTVQPVPFYDWTPAS